VALASKLTPLLILFIGLMGVLTLVVEGVFGIPFRGDVPMMLVAALLFLIAYLALGALLQLLARELATGRALTGLLVSPAFGFAGVGFPVIGMNVFAQLQGLADRWGKFLRPQGRNHAVVGCDEQLIIEELSQACEGMDLRRKV